MQLRVVTDQPWDVPADVLVIPIVGEPAFDGPLGELDRRTGGELQAAVDDLTGPAASGEPAASPAPSPSPTGDLRPAGSG